MKYFKDIEILYEIFYIIYKYCPISNSNVDTAITDMNNIELSSDSDSSNEVYNINNINNRNNIVNNSRNSDSENRNTNISDSEYYNIVTSILVYSSIGENRGDLSNFLNNECVNRYVTWYRLYNFLLGRSLAKCHIFLIRHMLSKKLAKCNLAKCNLVKCPTPLRCSLPYELFSEFIYTLIFDYYCLFHVTIPFIIMFKLDI